MSEYLVLIYDNESRWATGTPADFDTMMKGHNEFGENNAQALRGGNALEPTSTATSLRRDASGKLVVTDGAFTETKEALGGYYLIEASDLDQAIAIASQVPTLNGGVEVRPVRVFE